MARDGKRSIRCRYAGGEVTREVGLIRAGRRGDDHPPFSGGVGHFCPHHPRTALAPADHTRTREGGGVGVKSPWRHTPISEGCAKSFFGLLNTFQRQSLSLKVLTA